MTINEQFDDELCGPCLQTLTVYRVSDGEKINELLVDSLNKKIVFYNNKNGYANNDYIKNIKIIDVFMPNKSVTLNEKGEYYWKDDKEWEQIKNFIKFYNIFR